MKKVNHRRVGALNSRQTMSLEYAFALSRKAAMAEQRASEATSVAMSQIRHTVA